jgi:hypothetical protein
MATIIRSNDIKSETREGSIALNKPCSSTPVTEICEQKFLGVISTSRFFETSPKGESNKYLLSSNMV